VESSHHRTAGGAAFAGIGFVVAAACLFAVNGTVSKLVLASGMSSLRLVEIRCAGAAAVLCLLALARNPRSLAVGRRDVVFLALYGVVGVAMVQWLYFVAIARIPVSVALLVEFTAPLLVALYVRFGRRQPVRPRVWPALALVLAGLALVAQVWAGLTLDALGLAAAVVDAGVLAAYYLLGEHGLAARDPVPLAALGFGAAALFWMVLLPPWTFPAGRLAEPVHAVGTLTLPAGVLVAWVVLLGTVAPFVLVLLGLRRIGATRAGLLGTLEPVLAGGVAWLVLGERLGWVQIAGAAVVLAGIVLAETARTPSASAAPPDVVLPFDADARAEPLPASDA
jgi:drug/metabolite transporter (DMT)-like permease